MRVFKASHVCLATVKWLSSNRKPPCFRKCSQTNPSCIRQWKGCPLHNNLINGCADRTAGFSPRTGPRHSRQNSGLLTAHRSPPQQTEQRASHRAQVPATADRLLNQSLSRWLSPSLSLSPYCLFPFILLLFVLSCLLFCSGLLNCFV